MTGLTYVYFIRDPAGLVKIGYAGDPVSRLGGLQSSHAGKLSIVRIIEGGPATERWLHRKFSPGRVRGEWFEFHPDMLTVVPPDEIPARGVVKPKLRLSLREGLVDLDASGICANRDDLLVLALLPYFWEDDLSAIVAWIRDRTGVPYPDAGVQTARNP